MDDEKLKQRIDALRAEGMNALTARQQALAEHAVEERERDERLYALEAEELIADEARWRAKWESEPWRDTWDRLMQAIAGVPTVEHLIAVPPFALVQSVADVRLVTPKQGTTGIVCGVSWMSDGALRGYVVMSSKGVPDDLNTFRAASSVATPMICDPKWIRVVGYRAGCSPDDVRAVIGAAIQLKRHRSNPRNRPS